ncbi:putative porin [bacterium]|nr:putative porin [candidate division CSSED10-310 bacterium]
MIFRGKLISGLITVALLGGVIGTHAAWTDTFSLNGDLRYRYASTEKEGSEDRDRHRIRTRLGVSAEVVEGVKIHIQLATGADDPTSTNQDLSHSFSAKSINLNLAYAEWKATEMLKFYAGKSKTPFLLPGGSELIWDGDLNPEGISVMFESQSDVKVYVNAAYLIVDERKTDTDDGYLAAGQLGVRIPIGNAKLDLGGGYYQYINQEGYGPYGAGGKGNSLDEDGYYTMDYSIAEAYLVVSAKVGNVPLNLYGHYAVNTEAEDDDTGYLAGISIGKVKDAMSWQLKYNYRRLESDAVVGAFSHSDFIGGGTNGKGHNVSFALGLAKNVSTAVSYFMDDIGLDGSSSDYKDLQIDLNFKF